MQLGEVVRTVRESNCEKARHFVLADSKHPGIVRSDMTDNEKKELLAQMTFSSDYGCMLLHRFVDGKFVWFGNVDFAHMLKLSLYDVACPGFCGILGDMHHPDTEMVTVCQASQVSSYTVALQITWVIVSSSLYIMSLI